MISTLAVALCAFAFFLPVSIAGINALAVVMTALVLEQVSRGRPLPWKRLRGPACAALWAYCAVALIVSLAGVAPALSLKMLYKDLHKVWILSLLLIALDWESSPLCLWGLAAGFACVSVVGIFETAKSLGAAQWVRAHGFVHPVTFGEQLALGLLGGLCFRNEPWARRWGPSLLALCGATLVLNQTRGAVLGLAAGLAAAGLLDARLRRFWPWALAAAAGVFLAWEVMPTGGRSLHHLLSQPELVLPSGQINPYEGRVELWRAAWRMFVDHPWTGVGPGNYHTLFTSYFQGSIDSETSWGSAHNLYLHQLAERGLLGLAALAAALGSLTVGAWRRARKSPAAANVWALSAMAAFLVMNLTEVAFQNEQMTTLVLFIWAWAESNGRRTA